MLRPILVSRLRRRLTRPVERTIGPRKPKTFTGFCSNSKPSAKRKGRKEQMPYTDVDVADLLTALQGRWRPVYQEVDGQMVSPAVTAATMLELQGNDFRVEKDGTVAYDGTFTFDPLASPMRVVLIYK